MTTCKQPKSQEDLTPPPPSLRGKGEQDRSLYQSVVPVPSPLRGGLGRGYLYLFQKSISAKSSKSSGFTIIECLLAIILVGIMMTAVAPVIVLSVATRLQARRVEQASQAARSYIDAVQTGTVPAPANAIVLTDPSDRTSFVTLATAPASTLPTCTDTRSTDPTSIYPYCQNEATSSLYCVDNGGGCVGGNTKDFIVQAFRSAAVPPPPPASAPPDDGSQGYLLGVRVYRADGFDGTSVLTTTKERQQNNQPTKVGTNTGGRGQRNAPMVELTTEIRPNVRLLTPPVPGITPSPTSPSPGDAMNKLCDRLGGCGK